MLLLEKLIFSLMKVRALKGAYKRILELDQKELAFEGFALGTPLGTPGDTDNANRWLCVRLRANGRNIVDQQLPTLLDVTCCVRLRTLLHVVGCCCVLLPKV